MRQATWEELFKAAEAKEEAERPPIWQRFLAAAWEDAVTMAVLLFALIVVVTSVTAARWVSEMPSLVGIAALALFLGLALAKLRVPEVLAHVIALAVGGLAVVQVASSSLGGPFADRAAELADRMNLWFAALTSGGISTDNIPFVVLVVSLSYSTSYLAAWSVFRWYNAWIALVPGGVGLLTNISYQEDPNSLALLFYLFAAIILVARVHVLRHVREWRERNTNYPDFISLYVLNITVWVAVGLLAIAWVMPQPKSGSALLSAWERVTSPVAGPLTDLSRVFASVDSRRGGGGVHQFGSTLPLQGEITLGGGEVMRVVVTEPGFLRAQAYDHYTAQGWRVSPNVQITSSVWPPLRTIQPLDEARRQFRRTVSVQVTLAKRQGVIVSLGTPSAVSIESRIVYGPDPSDIAGVRPTKPLSAGTEYRVDSTTSSASPARLRAAATTYPAWIGPYLQLPGDLPPRVRAKAREVATGANNPFDIATQIETFLRSYAIDTKIPQTPHDRDSVDYFLFTLHRGYFDYHASAMVVLLRSLGIPARVAVGYTVRHQDRIPDTNTYLITESNAFAWPEVYFPGLGWVEFNPTPSEPRINRSGADDQFFADEGEADFLDDDLFLDQFFPDTDQASGSLDDLVREERSNLVGNIILGIVVLFLGVTIIGGGLFHFSWSHGLGGLDYATQTWEKTVRLARWARIPFFPQQTPTEYIERLQEELSEVPDVELIGQSFLKARWGKKELTEREKERLTEVWRRVRNTLMARMLRWK